MSHRRPHGARPLTSRGRSIKGGVLPLDEIKAELRALHWLDPRARRSYLALGPCASAVYFIVEADDPTSPIKIGVSTELHRRLVELQIGNPRLLRVRQVVPGDRDLEHELHRRWDGDFLRREWFRYSEEILLEADRLAARAIASCEEAA